MIHRKACEKIASTDAPAARRRSALVRLALLTLAACALGGSSAPAGESPPAMPAAAAAPRIEGAYAVDGTAAEIRVIHLKNDYFQITSSEGWEGVGILDGTVYRGVFRQPSLPDGPAGGMGDQTVDFRDPEHPSMKATYSFRAQGDFTQRWSRLRPASGGDVHVDELPEAVKKVAPAYPSDMRPAEGTVLVQALVLEDGSVGDVRVVKSVPLLDEAAMACVRQWRFKPARAAGRPVAVWVAVPVRFGP